MKFLFIIFYEFNKDFIITIMAQGKNKKNFGKKGMKKKVVDSLSRK